jgi:sucrose phosphorylase
LPQTHRVIQLFRGVLDLVAPGVALITETNVPHAENISYFGDGTNEAQLVYNFALPPLVLHALQIGSARTFAYWAAGLSLPSDRVTFFNFLASHDGIGLNPARGILSAVEIEALVAQVVAHGGLVSHKHNPDGTQSPYELNVNYFDALSDPRGDEPLQTQVDRFMVAQAIMLAVVGVPGIYFHSLFGSRGWPEGVRLTGRNRTINRQKLELATIEAELEDRTSLRWQVFRRYTGLLRARSSSPAFHPHGRQHMVELDDEAILAILRTSADGHEQALCLHNVCAQPRRAAIPASLFGPARPPDPHGMAEAGGYVRCAARAGGAAVVDLLTGRGVDCLTVGSATPSQHLTVQLAPYQVMWLKWTG